MGKYEAGVFPGNQFDRRRPAQTYHAKNRNVDWDSAALLRVALASRFSPGISGCYKLLIRNADQEGHLQFLRRTGLIAGQAQKKGWRELIMPARTVLCQSLKSRFQ